MVTAPFAIVAFWGFTYLRDCVHALEAPGVPVQFVYQAPTGNLTLSAESYAIDVRHGAIFITAPRLKDSKGTVIAQLDTLRATGLSLWNGYDQIIRIRARNLKGRIVRLKNGRLDFEDYLPERKASGSVVPFDVEVDRCEVKVVDLVGGTPWTGTLKTPQIKVVGIGQDWVATTKAEISNAGLIETRIQNIQSDGGLQISGSSPSLSSHRCSGTFLTRLKRLVSAI